MRYERVQVLRFFAATAVVAFHAQATALNYVPAQRYEWLDYGRFGVDLFFVISGFVIRATIQREPTASFFLRRRIERVVPLYWLCSLAAFLLLAVGGVSRGGIDVGETGEKLGLSLGFVSWAIRWDHAPLVYVGWSLEFEMLFYLLTAGLLLWTKRPTLPLVIILGGSILAGAFTGAETGSAAQIFFEGPILIEFIFGLLIADMVLGLRPYAAVALTLLVLVLAVSPLGWGSRVWIGGIPGALLVGPAVWIDGRKVAVSAPTHWLAWLGDASYSIYLVQVFTISAICKLVVRLVPGLPLPALILAITVTTVAAGTLLFALAERPIQRFTHRFGRGGTDAQTKRPATQDA